MGIFSAIGRLFRRSADSPPAPPPSVVIQPLTEPDGPDMEVSVEHRVVDDLGEGQLSRLRSRPAAAHKRGVAGWDWSVDDDIFGITCVIEYESSSGGGSNRRVTIRAIGGKDDGRIFWQCFCHERSAARAFRVDRMRCVVDLDGEVHDPLKYMIDELRLDLPAWAVSALRCDGRETGFAAGSSADKQAPEGASGEKPGVAQRRAARDGLRVLVGLSRSDGTMHPAELAAIVGYIEEKCERVGISVSDADRKALAGYLKRQYPSRDVLERCLEALEREPFDHKMLFLEAATAVIDADGERHPAEELLIEEVRAALSATSSTSSSP